jgi:CBS domain-containing protein
MPQRSIRTIIENRKTLTLGAKTTVSEAARLMKKNKVGVVLVEDGRFVGIFTERDALFRVLAEGRDAQTTRIADVMTPDPLTIHPDKPFGHALHIMYENGFRHVPVVKEGKPLGIVSARDALSLELDEFESQLRSREHIAEILA